MTSQSSDARPSSSVWNIENVIAELHQLRERSLVARRRADRPVKLPSRKALAGIVENLSTALFPNRLGSREIAACSIDYFVGHTLDLTLSALLEEVLREIQFTEETTGADQQRPRAIQAVNDFACRLPQIRELLETDIQAAFDGDPAARTLDEVLACYPGINAITHHRIAHVFHELGLPLIARIIADISHSTTGIDIHPGARIQGSFFIDHGTGVVIGETAVIGSRVRLYQAVTLGAKLIPALENSKSVRGLPRHPIVEDDVVIYAGATILGPITIGKRSIIGGNVWLTRSVPPDSKITQAKTRDDQHDGGSGI